MTRDEHAKNSVTRTFFRSANGSLKSPLAFALRICAITLALVAALGFYSHVRAQEGNHPGTIVLPLRPLAPLSTVQVPPVFGMDGIVADKSAAIRLGKALFWEMQAGSDDTQA